MAEPPRFGRLSPQASRMALSRRFSRTDEPDRS